MRKFWTMEEEIFVIENHDKVPPEIMAEKLNVLRKQYTGKRRHLLSKYADGKPLETEEEKREVIEKIKARHGEIKAEEDRRKKEIEFIINNHETMSIKEIAIELGAHYSTIHNKWQDLVQDGTINADDSNVNRQRVKKPKKTKLKLKPMPKEQKIPREVIENQKELKRKLNILDGNMELGKRYRAIENNYDRKKGQKRFEGKLIQITDKHYTFEGKYRESFLKLDFVSDKYSIKEA